MTAKKHETTGKLHPMPLVRVDLVLLCVQDGDLKVLLSLRDGAPFKGSWGLPGGVLRIDLDASLEAAAQRIAGERLNRELPHVRLVSTVGGADRDPRAPWAMSVIYSSLVPPDWAAVPGKRVQALEWTSVAKVLKDRDLAFDHAALVEIAVLATRQEVAALRFPPGWVTGPFTLGELQGLSEAVLGAPIDKVTFRRRMEVAQIAKPMVGQMRLTGAHRPAQLYGFDELGRSASS